ncbi:uncharacterized protein [Elaeis guineensis]|uniref:Uncharacterized protein LOC105043123 isoform X2 n=1 Tax=Elaeis guineensis var. tenera TaxID=51953 RepID=A0A8N4IFE1_ELAGV|nr:uncharacterized protein LOC105043123 isoform X2 [Elaeis guineensis]
MAETERRGEGRNEQAERRTKKRSRRRREGGKEVVVAAAAVGEEGKGASTDPLVVLGPDIMTKMLEFLDARSVARSIVVSPRWHEIATSDRLWAAKCEELWKGKAHIPHMSKGRGLSRLAAYSLSIMDGKRTAPEYWRNLDPSWKGTGPPMRRYFHPNGSQTADPNDKVWGGHECTFSIITSYIGKGQIRNHYVRINRWPPMTVSRREDWSWEMANHLYCYNSVPDAEKEGGTGPLFPVW